MCEKEGNMERKKLSKNGRNKETMEEKCIEENEIQNEVNN